MTLDIGILRAMPDDCRAGMQVTGWSVDSRTLAPGDLFSPCAARITTDTITSRRPSEGRRGRQWWTPVPAEPASRWSSGHAGARCRRWRAGPAAVGRRVVGVTGSAGQDNHEGRHRADAVGSAMQVGKTDGNFNNHVGVPLSILRLPDEAASAVLEMGMNHAGEIRDLARIARAERRAW